MATIRRRGDSWFAQVKKSGVRRSKSFSTKGMAQKWAIKTERDIELGEIGLSPKSTGGHTLAEAAKRYNTEQGHSFSRSKMEHLKRAVKVWGDVRLESAQQVDIQKIFAASKYAGTSLELALATIGGVVKYARTVWLWEVSEQPWHDTSNAMKRRGAIKPINRRTRRCSPDEEQAIASHWLSNVVPHSVVPFLIDTPMRSGELAALRWDDVERKDANKFIVTIRERKGTKADDRVPLLGRSGPIMEGWWASRGNTGFVLGADQGLLYRAFKKATDAADIKDMVMHDLRHEGISRLFDAGWNIPQVAVVSGHRSWEHLKRYTHISAEDLLFG
ncbi:MAG: tyrosine-type recombinase/integrase [Roseobacter sp.]|uniref:site-specific integrase n=1 Tax=Tateyamaria sp. TaxID=1929288 RepID=UPI0032811431